ncbi:AP-3 complex subunit delta-like [Amphibalanus amphitrite]|uniref:AP-3 complex subunit delta-like n=1 Tax=Amphibalanus amphitrite TaxID=1232801 RepID=UPI001C928887|nr:AP-3 complex subunit delta-like [Amphibalanus amphitrite]
MSEDHWGIFLANTEDKHAKRKPKKKKRYAEENTASAFGSRTIYEGSEADKEEVPTKVKDKQRKKRKKDPDMPEKIPIWFGEQQEDEDMHDIAPPPEASALGGQTVNVGSEAAEEVLTKVDKKRKKKKKKKDLDKFEEIPTRLGEEQDLHDDAPPAEASALGGQTVDVGSEAAVKVLTKVEKKRKKKKKDLVMMEEIRTWLGEEQDMHDDAPPAEASALGGQTVDGELIYS